MRVRHSAGLSNRVLSGVACPWFTFGAWSSTREALNVDRLATVIILVPNGVPLSSLTTLMWGIGLANASGQTALAQSRTCLSSRRGLVNTSA